MLKIIYGGGFNLYIIIKKHILIVIIRILNSRKHSWNICYVISVLNMKVFSISRHWIYWSFKKISVTCSWKRRDRGEVVKPLKMKVKLRGGVKVKLVRIHVSRLSYTCGLDSRWRGLNPVVTHFPPYPLR